MAAPEQHGGRGRADDQVDGGKTRRDGRRALRLDAQRSRERILRAAAALLERDPRLPLSEVAAAAGVARSTLSRHFPTRADLTRALPEDPDRQPADERKDDRRPWTMFDARGPETEGSGPRRGDHTQLMPAGLLGRAEPLPLEALHVLDEVPPHLVADQLVAEAQRMAEVPVALYVIDVDGSGLLCLAGREHRLK